MLRAKSPLRSPTLSRLRRCKRPALLWLLLLCPASAWAYLDPNAGGLLYQILFPLIVAVGAAWAGLRHRVGYWWARLCGRVRGQEPDPGAPADTGPKSRRDD